MFLASWRAFARPISFFALGIVIVSSLSQIPWSPPGTVRIELRLDRDSTVRFYWNESDEQPQSAAISAGQRTTLEFPLPSTRMYRLRIDPFLQATGEKAVIYRVALRLRDGLEVEIPLQTLATWAFINTSRPVVLDNALSFQSTSRDAYFFGPVALPATSLIDKLASFGREQMRSAEFIIQLLLLGTACIFLLSLGLRAALAGSLILAALFGAMYGMLPLLSKLLPRDSFDVSTAVGHAAFLGLSVMPSRLTVILSGVAAVLLGLAYGRRLSFDGAAKPEPLGSPNISPTSDGVRELVIASVLILALSIMLMPDLNAVARSLSTSSFTNQWDANNVVTWAGFVAEGKQPYRDFWDPYGGLWIFDLPLPAGPLLRLGYMATLYGTFGMALWRLLGKRLRVSLPLLAIVVVAGMAGILPSPERYLLSVSVVLSFIAIDHGAPFLSSGLLWFWIACALGLWGEPAQLLYAAPAVLLTQAYVELRSGNMGIRPRIVRAFRTFADPVACVIAFLIFLAWRHELNGFVTSYIQISTSANYGLLPTPLRFEFEHPLNWMNIGVFAPLALAFFGGLCLSALSQESERRIALAVIGMSIIGQFILQKHLIRPIGIQLLLPSVVGVLLLLALLWKRNARRLAIAALTGALVTCIVLNPQTFNVIRSDFFLGFERTFSTYRVLANEPALLKAANRAAYSEQRFPNFKQELAIAEKLRLHQTKSIFVLGDLPVLYLLSPGPVPFHINLYSASPIGAQLDMKQWLSQIKPDIVVIDPDAFVFDEIQMIVRVPIVAVEVILNYVPYDQVGTYPLLAPRSAKQAIPLGFWRDLLGPNIDFGYLLTDIRDGDRTSCSPEQPLPNCHRYVEVSFQSDVPSPQRMTLPVTVGPFAFEVAFVRVPGQRSYLVPIDRIWFWRAGEAMGIGPLLQPGSDLHLTTTIVGEMATRAILY